MAAVQRTIAVFAIILSCLLVIITASLNPKISVLGNTNSVVYLSCNIPIGVNPNTIRWSHNGRSITTSSKYAISYTRLEVRNVVPADEGRYKCSYITTLGNTAELAAGEIFVLGAAAFVQNKTQEVCAYAGKSAKFDTRLEYVGAGASGKTQTTNLLQLYYQNQNGGYILSYSCSSFQSQTCPPSGRIVVERTPNSHQFDIFLRLRQVTERDSGTYIARVENVDPLGGGVTYIQKTFILNVKEPPLLPDIVLQAQGNPIDGSIYSLSCRVDTNIDQYANFELQWTYSDGRVIKSGQQAQLNITFEPLVKAEHEGQYTCTMVVVLNDSESQLTSNKTIAVLVEARNDEEDFQISFGPIDLRQCTNWMLNREEGAKVEEAIRQEITQVVINQCDCDITAESIQTKYMKCLDSDQLGYRATFRGTHTLTASDFITHLESWLDSSNSVIKLGWFLLDLDTTCPVVVPNNATSTSGWCDTAPQATTETPNIAVTVQPTHSGILNHTQISECVSTCLISQVLV